MYYLFLPILLLPFAEIAGFVVIGGRIGLGASLLWLVSATSLGFYILRTKGFASWGQAQKMATAENWSFGRALSDSFCYLIGAILLIFPGFISDFIAIPFLIAPLRHIFGKKAPQDTHETIIDAEYRRTDKDDHQITH